MKLRRSTIMEFLEYLMAILFVVDINSVWLRSYELGDYFFGWVLVGVMFAYLLIGKVPIRRRNIKVFLFLLVYSMLMGWQNGQISVIARIIVEVVLGISLLLVVIENNAVSERSNLLIKISNVVSFIAVLSLIFYFFGTILDVMPGKASVSFYWGYMKNVNSYFNIYFESQTVVFAGRNFARNCACFTEAPMYNFLLCIALTVEVFMREKILVKRVLMLLLTIITTFATTGFIMVALIGVLFILRDVVDKRKKLRWYHVIILILAPIICFMLYNGLDSLWTMKQIDAAGSVAARSSDIRACIRAWKTSPILGVGILNYKPIYSFFPAGRTMLGLSCGFPIVLAQTGIMLLAWPIVGMIKVKRSTWQYLFFITFMVLFMIVNVPYKLICVLCVGYALQSKKVSDLFYCS